MVKILEQGDRMTLSHFDTQILCALIEGPLISYQIARRVEEDAKDGIKLSNGALYPALRQLIRFRFINQLSGKDYEITWLGKSVLRADIARLKRLVELAEKRDGFI